MTGPRPAALDYCNGAGHYTVCPDAPSYDPINTGWKSCGHSWHVWHGLSPALVDAGGCPQFSGDYAAPVASRPRCKVGAWEVT